MDAVGEVQKAWDHPAPRGARPPAASHLSPWHVTAASVHASTSCRDVQTHAFPSQVLQLLQLQGLLLGSCRSPLPTSSWSSHAGLLPLWIRNICAT